MKFGIICGHGAGDPGADSKTYGSEANMVRQLAPYVKKYLSQYGSTDIFDTTINYYNHLQGNYVNFTGYDYIIELHGNAGAHDPNGNGATTGIETWITTSEAQSVVEQAICDEIAKLGFKNRGVKRCDFFVIRTIKAQGVSCCLIENGFMDDKDDMTKIFTDMDGYAKALVDGVAKGWGLTATGDPVEPEAPVISGSQYKVGQTVRFSSCFYTAADASTHNAALTVPNMSVDEGTISEVLTVNGVTVYNLTGICWVNDGDIREVISGGGSGSSGASGDGSVMNYIPSDFVYENATFTCTVDEGIHILEAPSLYGKRTGLFYEKGESVHYDGFVRREGYVWISWISNTTGTRRWMAAGELNKNGINTNPYGTFQ